MIEKLEKYWLYISIALFFIVILSVFLWPNIARTLVWIIILIGTLAAVIFAVNLDFRFYRQGRMDHEGLVRTVTLDVLEIIITIITALLIAGFAGATLGLTIGKSIEAAHPGMGVVSGIIAGIMIGVFSGLCVSSIIHWGKIKLISMQIHK
jgi:hypothetical protein